MKGRGVRGNRRFPVRGKIIERRKKKKIIEVIEEVDLRGGGVERFERRKNEMEGDVIIEEAIVFEMVR
jgi:hypothetical protein